MNSPSKSFIISFTLLFISLSCLGQLKKDWRFNANMIRFNVDLNEFVNISGTDESTGPIRDSGVGFQLDAGFKSKDHLIHGIIYTHYAGDLAEDGRYFVNSVLASAAYEINLREERFKIIPQLAMGPQYYTLKTSSGEKTTHSDPMQMRYKLNTEVKFTSNFYLNASIQYTYNLFGMMYNKMIADTQRNTTSLDFGIGLSYYLR